MNEPAIFETPTKTMPLDNDASDRGRRFTARPAPHSEVHNVYGMENSRATYEGLLKLRPNVRPFVMTRATFAGGQKFAVTWTGDNSSTWDHLKLAVQQMLNLGLSGISWSGADIPGFIGGASPESGNALVRDRRLHTYFPKPCRQRRAARRAVGRWSGASRDTPPLHRGAVSADALFLRGCRAELAHGRPDHARRSFTTIRRCRRLRAISRWPSRSAATCWWRRRRSRNPPTL